MSEFLVVEGSEPFCVVNALRSSANSVFSHSLFAFILASSASVLSFDSFNVWISRVDFKEPSDAWCVFARFKIKFNIAF